MIKAGKHYISKTGRVWTCTKDYLDEGRKKGFFSCKEMEVNRGIFDEHDIKSGILTEALPDSVLVTKHCKD